MDKAPSQTHFPQQEDSEQQTCENEALADEVKAYLKSFRTREGLYNFFETQRSREELAYYCQKVAEYLHDQKIPNLIIIDRSSRPLYIGLIEFWRAKYPNEKLPGIYFMNPKGFKARESLTEDDLEEIQMDSLWKEDSVEYQQIRTEEDILEEIEKVYSQLSKDKEKPLLIFDSCIHSGGTLSPVKDILAKSGFSNIKIGTANKANEDATIQPDFHIEDSPSTGCYPFDRDRMIEKTFDHVFSVRNKDPQSIALSIRLRQEIKKIVQEALNKNTKNTRNSILDKLRKNRFW